MVRERPQSLTADCLWIVCSFRGLKGGEYRRHGKDFKGTTVSSEASACTATVTSRIRSN